MDNNDMNQWRSLKQFILERGCPEFEALVPLRDKGKKDPTLKPALDQHYSKSRKRADESTAKEDACWLRIMFSALQNMDVSNNNFIPHEGELRFLDLGCCPGGFSDYVLTTNRNARGVGVSLGVENGGHGLAIPSRRRARFEIHWADLTYYDICSPKPPPSQKPGVVSLPISGPFQLVMLDGHHRRPQESEETRKWDIDRLLLSQLIIAFAFLDLGGVLLVKLHHLESYTTAGILYMLDKLFERTIAVKPQTVHRDRGSFYAVASGFGLGIQGNERDTCLDNMKEVWWELTYGGPEGEGRYLEGDDLDFIVDFDTLSGRYLDRIIELGRSSWDLQSRALRNMHTKIAERCGEER